MASNDPKEPWIIRYGPAIIAINFILYIALEILKRLHYVR